MGSKAAFRLKDWIREVPDFPKPGILFKDITTLLKEPAALREAADRLAERFADHRIDHVVGIEARGFIFAPLVAVRLNAGFVPVRKPGKLPARTAARTYELEYGTDTLEMHVDGLASGDRVALVDDLLATGGTARAAADLVDSVGARVEAIGFVVELTYLEGRRRLEGYDVVESLVRY
ncbi:MAG: adenine phosphoribosyltransferase [Acidobacteria bacterium]|nr:adenine phosphoribosyltransferase [Acidobacteriota bacterium]MCY3963937.1 adenine phosphoribosyltransferase [Acidobacteriota bacterium]MCY3969541.1 adenine phosphoribosyltransferase [Acidobacteriota bacterium]